MKVSYTEQEMFKSKEVCQSFDLNKTKLLAEKIGTKRIIFSGMGSSLIFPGKQAKHRSLLYNLANRVEVYFASDFLQYTDFSDTFLFLCSNSGNTKEVLLLLEHAKAHGAICVGITAIQDSPLAKRCDEVFLLSGGLEKGVAATKSVIEQALICDSLIFHLAQQQGKEINFEELHRKLRETGEIIARNVELLLGKKLLSGLAQSPQYFFVGLDTGVAEELTLKAIEIIRKPTIFYPDTHILHGPAETINQGSLVMVNPSQFTLFLSNFKDFGKRTSLHIFCLGESLGIDYLQIESTKLFENYCFLAGGWALLRNLANHLKIDIDSPQKISKVGVPFRT